MATLYRSAAVELEVRDASSHDVLWFGIRAALERDEIERVCTIAGAWLEHTERPLALHIDAGEALEALDAGKLLCIVGRLLEHREAIQAKLRGTCLQARVDDATRAAKDLFLALYQPAAPFDLVEGAQAAETFLAKL